MSGTGRAVYSPRDHLTSRVFLGPLRVWIEMGLFHRGGGGGRRSEAETSKELSPARVTGARLNQKMMVGGYPPEQPLLQSEASVGLFVGWAAATSWWGGPGVGHAVQGLPALLRRTLI